MNRISFLDLEFDSPSEAEVERWLATRSANSSFAYVVTPNVDHMVRLARVDADLRQAYTNADLCLCDSRVLARLARFTNVDLGVVPGSDVVATLFDRVLNPDDTICVIGMSAKHIADLAHKYSNIVILHHSPPMGLRHDHNARAEAVKFALEAKARFTLLAVGSPQQELLAWEMHQAGASLGTALCIGASIDFLVGAQRRAPLFVRRLGIEWAWRLFTQPRRLARRYLIDGPAIFPMVWQWRKAQLANKK